MSRSHRRRRQSCCCIGRGIWNEACTSNVTRLLFASVGHQQEAGRRPALSTMELASILCKRRRSSESKNKCMALKAAVRSETSTDCSPTIFITHVMTLHLPLTHGTLIKNSSDTDFPFRLMCDRHQPRHGSITSALTPCSTKPHRTIGCCSAISGI